MSELTDKERITRLEAEMLEMKKFSEKVSVHMANEDKTMQNLKSTQQRNFYLTIIFILAVIIASDYMQVKAMKDVVKNAVIEKVLNQ